MDEEDLAEDDDFDEEDLEEVDGDFDADEDLVDENLGAACHRSKKVKTTTYSKVIGKFIARLDKIMRSSRSKPGKRRSALGTRRRNRKNMKKNKISKVGGEAVRSFLRDIRRSIENAPSRRLTPTRINRKAKIAARKARRNKSGKEKKQAKKAANESINKNRRYTERSFVRVVKRAFKRYSSKNGTKPEGCR
jgi:hypothetical protein